MKKLFIPCLYLLLATPVFAGSKMLTDGAEPFSKDSVDFSSDIELKEQVVIGRQTKKMSVSKLPVPIEQTPLTVSVVKSKTLNDLNIKDMLGLNKTTTGLRVLNAYGGFQIFRARGLDGVVVLSNGIRDERFQVYSSAPTSTFVGVDQIEVLKGPASAMSGYSAIGGVVNLLYKQPSPKTSLDARLSGGSWHTYSAQVGASGALSDKVNFRLDFSGVSSDGWRDNSKISNNVYLAIDYSPDLRNKFHFSAIAYDNRVHTDPGIPRFKDDIYDENDQKIYSTGDIPKGLNWKKTNYTYVDDHLNDKNISSTNVWEHLFSDKWKLREQVGISYNTLSYLQSEEFSHLTTKTPGIYKDYYMNGDEKIYISVDSIKREPFHFDYDNYYVGNQIELQGNLNLLGMKHVVSFGYDFSHFYLKRWQGSKFSGPATTTVMSIYNPITNPGYLDAKFTNIIRYKEYYNTISAFDNITILDNLSMMLALRYNMFKRDIRTDQIDDNKNVTKRGDESTLNDNAFTYKVGLVYEFAKNNRIYASVSNSFKPVRTVGDSKNVYLNSNGKVVEPNSTGKVYDPEKGVQYEVGIHSRVHNNLAVEFSTFYIEKINIVQNLGKNIEGKTVFGQVGRINSKGFEIEAKYAPMKYIDFNAGYALIITKAGEFSNTSVSKSNLKGNYLAYAPVNTAFGWLFFNNASAKKLFKLGIGFDYASKSYADLANKMPFAGAFVSNAMSSYSYKNWSLQLNVDNIFDKHYSKSAENSIQWLPEPGRSFTFTTIFKL